MTGTAGAGSDSQDDGSRPGAAQPGSQGEGAKAPGDDYVKKSQMIAALNSATAKTDEAIAEAARLRRELEEAKAAKAVKPPTREELRQLVESGNLTQAQADDLWDKQFAAQVKQQVVAEVGQASSAQELARKVNAELQGYKELVPDVWVPGSEERVRVGKAFDRLVSLGHDPKSPATEAAALFATYGDLDVLRASKSARPGSAETHSETGGHRPAGGGSEADVPKGLTPRQKEHYGRLIGQGIYADWKAVKAEVEAAPRRKAR